MVVTTKEFAIFIFRFVFMTVERAILSLGLWAVESTIIDVINDVVGCAA